MLSVRAAGRGVSLAVSCTCYFDATDDRYHPCLAGQSYQEEASGERLRVE